MGKAKKEKKSLQKNSASRRAVLADFLREEGASMPTPCGRCKRKNVPCRVNLSSGKCAECYAANMNCDLVVTRRECIRQVVSFWCRLADIGRGKIGRGEKETSRRASEVP